MLWGFIDDACINIWRKSFCWFLTTSHSLFPSLLKDGLQYKFNSRPTSISRQCCISARAEMANIQQACLYSSILCLLQASLISQDALFLTNTCRNSNILAWANFVHLCTTMLPEWGSLCYHLASPSTHVY
jgi:hypothetical protein